MPIWPSASRASSLITGKLKRAFTTYSHEKVDVQCGSAGHVTVDLFNLSHHSPSAALLVHLPPGPSRDGTPAPPPDFLQDWPVASINYRWGPAPEGSFKKWPTPVHDTAFAFAWLTSNLAPEKGRRDMYVYGSHLGAGLATSLALTEAHTHAPFGVRGVVAYNGVYNWTMFLPDHRINGPKNSLTPPPAPAEGSHLYHFDEQMPGLFDTPANLFDPFASPSLLFHNPGLLVPRSFGMSMADAAMIDALANKETDFAIPLKQPRKSHMVFPPRKSTLKIPETLLLHDSPAAQPHKKDARRTRKRAAAVAAAARGNTLEAHARELAELMRRSIEKVEVKERSKWDDEMDGWEDEVLRRVQTVDVGGETGSQEMGERAQEIAQEWLRDRT